MEFCCISRVFERPELLEAAVRLMMARVVDSRRSRAMIELSASRERTQEICQTVQTLIQSTQAIERVMMGAMQQVQKLRRTAQQVEHRVAGLRACEEEAS